MRGKHFLAVLPLACATFISMLAAKADSGSSLLIKTGELTRELTIAVSKVGEERTIEAKAGDDIFKIISQYCGTSNARRYYLPLFIAANAANADVSIGKTVLQSNAEVKLPACLFADEKLAAVPIGPTGAAWNRPFAINTKSLERYGSPYIGVGLPRWRPHKPGSGGSIESMAVAPSAAGASPPNLATIAGQSVDFSRLEVAYVVLPETLANAGPNIVTDYVDSSRLDDPQVRLQYEKLFKQTQSAAASASIETDAGVAIRATAFERAIRTQDILASNAPTDFTNLRTDAQVLTSGFQTGLSAVNLKPGVDGAAAAEALQLASLANPAQELTWEVTAPNDFEPYFGEVGELSVLGNIFWG